MEIKDALELPAGRELDAEVAKRLGKTVFNYIEDTDDGEGQEIWEVGSGKPLSYYSTDNGAACRLIEQIQEHGGLYGNDIFIEWWNDDEWYICNQSLYSRKGEPMQRYEVIGRAPKLAHAIARFFIVWAEKQKEYWGEYPVAEAA